MGISTVIALTVAAHLPLAVEADYFGLAAGAARGTVFDYRLHLKTQDGREEVVQVRFGTGATAWNVAEAVHDQLAVNGELTWVTAPTRGGRLYIYGTSRSPIADVTVLSGPGHPIRLVSRTVTRR